MLSLTVAQTAALGHGGDADGGRRRDAGGYRRQYRGLSATDIAALPANGIDIIDASNNVLSLTVAQYSALGTVALTPADVVTVADQCRHCRTVGGHDRSAGRVNVRLDRATTDNVLSLTAVAQVIRRSAPDLAAGDIVTLADTGANISAPFIRSDRRAGGLNIDTIDATDNVLSLTVAQYQALGVVTLTAADTVTLADAGATIAGLSAAQITALTNIDIFNATDNTLTLTAAQAVALAGTSITLTAADAVTLADSGAIIAAISAANISTLATKGLDFINATDDVLSLTVAQYSALGTIALTAGDAVTLADTGANIAALSSGAIGGLAAANVDTINSSTDALSLTVAQYLALIPTTTTLTAADTVTLADIGANIAALSAAAIGALAAKGIDTINASDDVLSLTVAQYQALGTVTLTGLTWCDPGRQRREYRSALGCGDRGACR